MGWMRTLLLGDIGNRLDIADAEEDIAHLRDRQSDANSQTRQNERVILALRDELGKQKLALAALTRFLLAKGVVSEDELAAFIEEVDAEDGNLDGKIPFEEKGRLRLRPSGTPLWKQRNGE